MSMDSEYLAIPGRTVHKPFSPMRRIVFPFLIFSLAIARAEVKPSALFGDNAVLQAGMEVPVWGTARDGEAVTVEIQGQKVSAAAKDGRWMVRLKALKAGGPFTMTVTGDNIVTAKNVLVGEVWLCSGQSNMARTLVPPDSVQPRQPYWEESAAAANHPEIRQFRVGGNSADEPAGEVTGSWEVCTPETARGFTAVGYYFAKDLQEALKTPVGLINASVGATGAASWISHEGLASKPELNKILERQERARQEYPASLEKFKAEEPKLLADYAAATEKAQKENLPVPRKPDGPRNPFTDAYRPSGYYNAKIAPLPPFALRGVLWYQGESNSGQAAEYGILFPALIDGWRQAWGKSDLPFLFVQLPEYQKTPPEMREVQMQVWLKTPRTAMVVTTDCGDAANIHPPDKRPVGARLALAARAMIYGENIEYSGPLFDALKVDGNKAVLAFKHIGGGLVAKDGPLKGFEIAGPDKKNFLPAKAEIQGDTVVVSNDQIPQPAAVRFGWANVPDVNFYNKSGLPASPFRTDSH